MKGILVVPIIARPPVIEGGSIHYDQITHMYIIIYKKAMELRAGKAGAQKELYTAVKQLIFKTEGKKIGTREFLSIVERIQGKTALLRGLLMGKRVNYCGRTVAGPDSSLKFGAIRLPEAWTKILTKPVKVAAYNIDHLTKLMHQGRITHIRLKKTGLRRFYTPNIRYKLEIGDIVERWLEDGDWVVNNRQPTLHRQSMMAYKVVIGKPLVIGLHLSYTSPMNCDFDGDENNAWLPQYLEVEAECDGLMNVIENIMSSEQNKPIMGLVMNSITGAYLLTDSRTLINDDLFFELLNLITNKDHFGTLYGRLIKYGVHPRSGYAIFSAMLPEDFYYSHAGVQIYEGIMVSGQLKKAHVGASARSIIQELHKEYGSQRTADFFTDAPWVIGKWLIERGFSVGLRDCISLAINEYGVEYDRSKKVLAEQMAEVYSKIESLGGKVDDPLEEMYREQQINQISEVPKTTGLLLAKEILSKDNSLGIMTDQGSGAKGTISNVGSMVGIIGFQFLKGQILKHTITGKTRLLPTFDENSLNPESYGFVAQSYYQGLTPEGLFFIQAAGRENLLDTALKTAETGTISRRLVKALENVVVGNDYSIRNISGTLFNPCYNFGYAISDTINLQSNFATFIDLKKTVARLNLKRGWLPKDQANKINTNRDKLGPLDQENILPIPVDGFPNGPPVQNTTITYNLNEQVNRATVKTKITKFEKARIIGTRAVQIENNSPLLVDNGDELDPVKIAKMEFNLGLLKIYIIRRFPDGSTEKVYPTLDNI
jgi:DNA-directed RNA polymerase beta' subunit/DNA-directed RNA polymerase subunit K/omega